MPTLDELNSLDSSSANEALLACCGSLQWAQTMASRRPYPSPEALHQEADRCWDAATRDEVLEAFDRHPRLGGVDRLREAFAATRDWSAAEQDGLTRADESVLQALADGNATYAARFGYLFILCATGRSASQMLASLRERLKNPAETEWEIAKGEQRKIMHLRLDRFLKSPAAG